MEVLQKKTTKKRVWRIVSVVIDKQDVYEVERLVEKRVIKGVIHFLVLWKDYPKEDALWTPLSQITETAIRLFYNPQPPNRIILDAVTSFRTAIHNSLRKGIISKRTMSIQFPRHVFNYLFKDKGRPVINKPGCFFSRLDFPSSYFSDGHFTSYNKFGEGHSIVFPMYMYSYAKFSAQNYDSDNKQLPRDFSETLFIRIVKKRV